MTTSVVEHDRPTFVRYLVLTGLCLAASIAYICRNSIGVAESTIRKELPQLTESDMGWVMSSFFLTYAIGQIPSGWLGSYLGNRRAIPFFSVAWSAATLLMSLAAGMPLLLTSRVTNGLAQAGLFPACTATIGRWFPDTRRAIASGSLGSFMSIGGAVGVAVTGLLVTRLGWRITFGVYSFLGLPFAALFYRWFRNSPSEHSWTNDSERQLVESSQPPKQAASMEDWPAIFLSPATWWICSQQFCRGAGQIFFASWFATYLQETRGVTVEQSGLLNSLPLIGIVAGCFVGGSLSDFILVRTGNRRLARSGVASTSLFLCALFVFAAYSIEDPLLAVCTISLGTFCANIGGPCAYTVTIDMGGRNIAILFSTMNMIGNLGAFVFIRMVPELVKFTGWDAVLGLFGVLYLAAAAFWLLVNPQGTILDQSLIRPKKN
jgi:sugar phosphate permease